MQNVGFSHDAADIDGFAMKLIWFSNCLFINPNTDEGLKPSTAGVRWPSGKASDSGSRGPRFEPHGHLVVSLSKIF